MNGPAIVLSLVSLGAGLGWLARGAFAPLLSEISKPLSFEIGDGEAVQSDLPEIPVGVAQ